jgi:spermidine synthase
MVSVLVVAACGLVYELLAATLASYLLGSSVVQFSIVIGIYLASMGLGALVSEKITAHAARRFIEVEVALAFVGGMSVPLLHLVFGRSGLFAPVLWGLVAFIGALVGLELPLLMRLLREEMSFRDLVARAFFVDYLGALVASVAFPLVLVPHLGLVRTGVATGVCNALVALWGTWALRERVEGSVTALRVTSCGVLGLLAAAMLEAPRIQALAGD